VTRKNNRARIISIDRFPFTPSTYPGSRPRYSFFFTSDGISRLKVGNLNRLLRDRNLPLEDERYAVIAYGSNACPGQLLAKKLTDVPVLYGRLLGAEAVYARRKAQGGYVPATLARKRRSRSSWVTLLTADQLSRMDVSEGRPNAYVLAELSSSRFFVGHCEISPVYSYVDIRGGVMTVNGDAVSLRSTTQKSAKSMLAGSERGEATDWLDFHRIPNLTPPPEFSRFLRGGSRG
jgi:hypothetical protein